MTRHRPKQPFVGRARDAGKLPDQLGMSAGIGGAAPGPATGAASPPTDRAPMTGPIGSGRDGPGDETQGIPPPAHGREGSLASQPSPKDTPSQSLSWRALVVAAVLVVGFVAVLVVVMRFTAPPAIDVTVLRWLQDRRTPLLTTIFRGVTTLGSPVGLIVTVAAFAGGLSLRRRSWQPILVSAVALGGAELIGTIIKVLVGRDRPLLVDRVPDVSAAGLDFPSGHSTQSAAAYTILALLIAQQVQRRFARGLLYAAAAIGAGLVGVSRLYLGVHWFTDVTASWLLGAAWALTVWAVAQSLQRRHQRESSGRAGIGSSEDGTS